MRTLGLYESAKRTANYLRVKHPDHVALLQAFIDGINYYIESNPSLPLEFYLIGHQPQPFKLEDVLVMGKLMAYDLCENVRQELNRYNLLMENNIPVERIEVLMPKYLEMIYPFSY